MPYFESKNSPRIYQLNPLDSAYGFVSQLQRAQGTGTSVSGKVERIYSVAGLGSFVTVYSSRSKPRIHISRAETADIRQLPTYTCRLFWDVLSMR